MPSGAVSSSDRSSKRSPPPKMTHSSPLVYSHSNSNPYTTSSSCSSPSGSSGSPSRKPSIRHTRHLLKGTELPVRFAVEMRREQQTILMNIDEALASLPGSSSEADEHQPQSQHFVPLSPSPFVPPHPTITSTLDPELQSAFLRVNQMISSSPETLRYQSHQPVVSPHQHSNQHRPSPPTRDEPENDENDSFIANASFDTRQYLQRHRLINNPKSSNQQSRQEPSRSSRSTSQATTPINIRRGIGRVDPRFYKILD